MAAASDVDLWTRMGDHSVGLILPQRLVEYRVHAASASTRRFYEQMAVTELIAANATCRRTGRPELTPQEWAELMRAQPLAQRLRRARLWRSRYLYRVGGGLLADGRPSGAAYLVLAALLAPKMVVRRFKRQVGARRPPRTAVTR